MIFELSICESLAAAADDRDELRAAIYKQVAKVAEIFDKICVNNKQRQKLDELLRCDDDDLDARTRSTIQSLEIRFARDQKIYERAQLELKSLRREESEMSATIEYFLLRRVFELGIEISDLKGLR
jgi:hypothetical protein